MQKLVVLQAKAKSQPDALTMLQSMWQVQLVALSVVFLEMRQTQQTQQTQYKTAETKTLSLMAIQTQLATAIIMQRALLGLHQRKLKTATTLQ